VNKAAESKSRVRSFKAPRGALITGPSPLEARDALVLLIRAKAPREELERAADRYINAIHEWGRATGRRLPTPSRAAIIRLLS
jgi:hypothetical protein